MELYSHIYGNVKVEGVVYARNIIISEINK